MEVQNTSREKYMAIPRRLITVSQYLMYIWVLLWVIPGLFIIPIDAVVEWFTGREFVDITYGMVAIAVLRVVGPIVWLVLLLMVWLRNA